MLQSYYDHRYDEQTAFLQAASAADDYPLLARSPSAELHAIRTTLALGLVHRVWLEPSRRVAFRRLTAGGYRGSLNGPRSARLHQLLIELPVISTYVQVVRMETTGALDTNWASLLLYLSRTAVNIISLHLGLSQNELPDAVFAGFANRALERLTLSWTSERRLARALGMLLSGSGGTLRKIDISAHADKSSLGILEVLHGRHLPQLRSIAVIGRETTTMPDSTQTILLSAPMLDSLATTGATAFVIARAMPRLAAQVERLRLNISPGYFEPMAFQLGAQTMAAFSKLHTLVIRFTSLGLPTPHPPIRLSALLALPPTLRHLELSSNSLDASFVPTLQEWADSPYALQLESLSVMAPGLVKEPIWLVKFVARNGIKLVWTEGL